MRNFIERMEAGYQHGVWTCDVKFSHGTEYSFMIWQENGWSEILLEDREQKFSSNQAIPNYTFIDRTRKTIHEGQEIFLSKIFKWLTAQGE